MYKIIVLSEAQDDLDNIYSYIAEDNILYATKTIREVWQTFQMIKDFPYL
jgi:plasmid stabilization system protein ParE